MANPLNTLKTLQPEVDYQALMAQLPGQSHPRRKLKELQNKGHLVRLKKGFYVFSRDFIGRSYSPHIVANLLYGPSYLSLEYALSFYGLIPERVEEFTSITSQKNKLFSTPIGAFSYRHLARTLYPLGVTLKKDEDGREFLIASPEKALLDLFLLKFDKTMRLTIEDVREALNHDLRVNLPELKRQLHRPSLENMRTFYKNRRWCKLLIQILLESP